LFGRKLKKKSTERDVYMEKERRDVPQITSSTSV